jgi:hypothetical protein
MSVCSVSQVMCTYQYFLCMQVSCQSNRPKGSSGLNLKYRLYVLIVDYLSTHLKQWVATTLCLSRCVIRSTVKKLRLVKLPLMARVRIHVNTQCRPIYLYVGTNCPEIELSQPWWVEISKTARSCYHVTSFWRMIHFDDLFGGQDNAVKNDLTFPEI